MTAEFSNPSPEGAEPLKLSPPDEQTAKIIDLFQPDIEQLDPNQMSDEDILDLYTSMWLHLSVQPKKLAETISDAVEIDSSSWHMRLHSIIEKSPFLEFYDKASEDELFSTMIVFLTQTKDNRDQYEYERKATKTLVDFYIIATAQKNDFQQERVGKIFDKMPHQLS